MLAIINYLRLSSRTCEKFLLWTLSGQWWLHRHATSPGVWGTHLPHWFYKQGYRRFYFYRSLEKGVKPFKNLRLIKFLILCISLNIWKIKLTIPYSKGSTQWNGLHCTIWTKKNIFAIDLISFSKSLTSSFHFSTFSHFRILEVHKI